MSTGIALDLNLDDSAWLATLDALLVDVKVDKRSGHTEDDARFKAIAAWANLIDDFVIACKMALRLLYRGNGSPEGVVAAPVGALYQRRDGGPGTTLYTKESGTGNTGWAPVGGAAAPADAQYIVAAASGSLSAERVLTTTDTVIVDSSVPGLTTLSTPLFTEQSDGGGITEELNYIEVSQTTGLSVTNVGLRHARLAIVRATPVSIGLANAAGSAASVAASDHVHAADITIYVPSSVMHELDLTAEPTVNFANGATTIGGIAATVANRAAANVFGTTAGQGLNISALATTATLLNQTTQTSPYLLIRASAIPNWRGDHGLNIELECTVGTFQANGDQLRVVTWQDAIITGTGMRGLVWGNFSGLTNQVSTLTGSTTQSTGGVQNAPAPAHVGLFMASPAGDFTVGYGSSVYSAGVWPTAWRMPLGLTGAAGSPILDLDTRIVIGLQTTSQAAPTTTVRIARIRFRRP